MTRKALIADAEFVAMWERGDSTEKMGVFYGVSRVTVLKRAKRSNLPMRPRYVQPCPDAVKKMWVAGSTSGEIATALNCAPSTVCAVARRQGLRSRRNLFDPAALNREDVAAHWFTTMRSGDLARALGVYKTRIGEVRMHFRLPPRTAFSRMSPEALAALALTYERDYAAFVAAAAEKDAQPLPQLPRVSGVPFWTVERDAQIIATDGRYAALSDVAHSLGVSFQIAQGRWHRLRVAL